MHYYASCSNIFVSGHIVTCYIGGKPPSCKHRDTSTFGAADVLFLDPLFSRYCGPHVLLIEVGPRMMTSVALCIDQDACPWIYPNSTLYISGIDLVQVELCCNHLLVFVIWKLDDFFSWPCDERILVELNSVVAMLSLSTVSLPIRLEATRKT